MESGGTCFDFCLDDSGGNIGVDDDDSGDDSDDGSDDDSDDDGELDVDDDSDVGEVVIVDVDDESCDFGVSGGEGGEKAIEERGGCSVETVMDEMELTGTILKKPSSSSTSSMVDSVVVLFVLMLLQLLMVAKGAVGEIL